MTFYKTALAEVEKGCGNGFGYVEGHICGEKEETSYYVLLCPVCQAKRQTLLMCQAEREKELKELQERLKRFDDFETDFFKKEYDLMIDKEITALLEGDGQ